MDTPLLLDSLRAVVPEVGAAAAAALSAWAGSLAMHWAARP